MDVYLSVPDSFGGMFRAYEAAEIARVAAPVYFKYEPGRVRRGHVQALDQRRLP